MKPQRRLALAKEIGNTLAKAQLSTLDGSGAAAALGAAAGRGFKEMSHHESPRRGANAGGLHARRAEEHLFALGGAREQLQKRRIQFDSDRE